MQALRLLTQAQLSEEETGQVWRKVLEETDIDDDEETYLQKMEEADIASMVQVKLECSNDDTDAAPESAGGKEFDQMDLFAHIFVNNLNLLKKASPVPSAPGLIQENKCVTFI